MPRESLQIGRAVEEYRSSPRRTQLTPGIRQDAVGPAIQAGIRTPHYSAISRGDLPLSHLPSLSTQFPPQRAGNRTPSPGVCPPASPYYISRRRSRARHWTAEGGGDSGDCVWLCIFAGIFELAAMFMHSKAAHARSSVIPGVSIVVLVPPISRCVVPAPVYPPRFLAPAAVIHTHLHAHAHPPPHPALDRDRDRAQPPRQCRPSSPGPVVRGRTLECSCPEASRANQPESRAVHAFTQSEEIEECDDLGRCCREARARPQTAYILHPAGVRLFAADLPRIPDGAETRGSVSAGRRREQTQKGTQRG
ncbi:hypothetical protein B0H17DRAFT_1148139 [Mycena rosella]|uniref:Uncharacterized protein n=1 Tax=Mycena rosella TaxID=1033263 RepID=A0AAD7CDY4_MYCRO|nr:hypothetical protein B0H17DRAFT_1148139 [Mycena rosella]